MKDNIQNKIDTIIGNLNFNLDISKFKLTEEYLNDFTITIITNCLYKDIIITYNEKIDKFIFKDTNKEYNDQDMWIIYYNVIKQLYYDNKTHINGLQDLINIIIQEDFKYLEQLYKKLPNFDKEKFEYLINAKKFDLI